MERPCYPSDLSDKQWQIIAPLIPQAKPGGRPRVVDTREVINAIMYLVRSGCAWRMLPREFPPWSTVHGYFRRFRLAGIWQEIHRLTARGCARCSGPGSHTQCGNH